MSAVTEPESTGIDPNCVYTHPTTGAVMTAEEVLAFEPTEADLRAAAERANTVAVPSNSLRWALGALVSAYGDEIDQDGTHFRDLRAAFDTDVQR